MECKIITYNSVEYIEMVELRNTILLEPIGLPYVDTAFADDENSILLGVFLPNGGDIVGCCMLIRKTEDTVRLRQMAIDTARQGQGLGAELIGFAEEVAKDHKYKNVYLHARKTALNFYTKQGYSIEGNEFIEVGIPHFEMMKTLK